MPVRTLPAGVTTGDGVLNIVNCKFAGIPGSNSSYGFWVHPNNSISTGRRPHIVARNTDFGDCGSHIVGTLGFTDYGDFTLDSVRWGSQRYGDFYTFENPTFLVNNKGSTTAYGTTQYAGAAPVPDTNCLYVGTGQTYATIYEAYLAAAHGDNIIVEPGTYIETEFFNPTAPLDIGTLPGAGFDKCIRIYGATENPDDVFIYSTVQDVAAHFFYWKLWNMTNVPLEFRGPGFFHVKIGYYSLYQYQEMIKLYWDNNGDPYPWTPSTVRSIMYSCNT